MSFIQAQATAVSNQLASEDSTKFPIALILPIATELLNLLGGCWKNGGQTLGANKPEDYLRDHYDVNSDEFEESLMGQVRGQTRHAIRIHRRTAGGLRVRDFSQEEVSKLSKAALKQLMEGETATRCLHELVS